MSSGVGCVNSLTPWPARDRARPNFRVTGNPLNFILPKTNTTPRVSFIGAFSAITARPVRTHHRASSSFMGAFSAGGRKRAIGPRILDCDIFRREPAGKNRRRGGRGSSSRRARCAPRGRVQAHQAGPGF
jgi:hypothetical protein